MILTDDEKAILDGRDGPAKQAALDLLVKYGIALGADRMLDTNNVCVGMFNYYPRNKIPGINPDDFSGAFAIQNMGVDPGPAATMEIPCTAVNTCTIATASCLDYLRYCNAPDDMYKSIEALLAFRKNRKFSEMTSCAPYLSGNVPMKGEHCAWGESSAVIFINSVLGARTNCEGLESSGAAAIVGKIPNAALHTDEGRRGTHLIHVEKIPSSGVEWDLMGYYCGKKVEDGIPVFVGDFGVLTLDMHKAFGASLSTTGGIDMYHIVGHTPEANTMEQAFGSNKPVMEFKYGKEEELYAKELLDSSKKTDVDIILLGCPFYSIQQIRKVADLLEGKQIKDGIHFIVMTAWMTKALADKSGYSKVIEEAGGYILVDTCPPQANLWPASITSLATDSGKMAHYGGANRNDLNIHLGSVEQCVNAAITGRWL